MKLAEGVDGLVHISQISTQRIKHPGAVLKEGQTVKVKILSIADGKISLSMKALAEQEADREEHETLIIRRPLQLPQGWRSVKGTEAVREEGVGMLNILKANEQIDQWRSVMFLYDSALKKGQYKDRDPE